MNISKKNIDNDASFILNAMKKEDVIIPPSSLVQHLACCSWLD
ncbi:hypothetical protein [Aeromonas dhakensis]|nr:hypothetical protein [Aeromonas dhakensis]MDD9212874.1 hypothetical protein [Aeromonas dhakensis]